MPEPHKKIAIALGLLFIAAAAFAERDYPIKSIDKRDVKVTRGFWFDRWETNRTATLQSNWRKCHETPRISNFSNAAERVSGGFGGIPFDDSDVFKVMEGTSYILAADPDAALEKKMSDFIAVVAKAQEPDGYLYTARTLGLNFSDEKDWRCTMMGPTRWSNTRSSHEFYNNGHLMEAAVAWYETTGRKDFLDIAIRAADLIDRTVGPGPTQLHLAAGHEEIELALVKLYRTTGVRRYLDLAKYFVDVKGYGDALGDAVFRQDGSLDFGAQLGLPGAYFQNHLPITNQTEAIGHSVRAGYLYCGVADIAALTGNEDYIRAIDRIWESVVNGKLYVTGGVGARPNGEQYGAMYELPNEWKNVYCETCAQISFILWNDRMFRFHGEAKYMDAAELTLHNSFVSGISLSGDEYFYPNPLSAKEGYKRSKWFGCSCCPVNDIRMIPQVPSLAWAEGNGAIYWNLFMEGVARIGGYEFEVRTDYPYSGKIALTVKRVGRPTALKIRIPGWAQGRVAPGTLYTQTAPASFMDVAVAVNGLALDGCPGLDGYLSIGRDWKVGDTVTIDLPMPVKRIQADDRVEADSGRLAVMKGPLVYVAEGFDNGGKAFDAILPADATFADDTITIGDKTYPALKASNGLKLIPYCLWGNRLPGNELETWFRAR